MKDSCTIIVFHYESFEFLLGCIREIRKFKHPEIEQHIIIADQSGMSTHTKVDYTYKKDEDISIVRMLQIDSGYSIDYIMRNVNIKTKYCCTLDVDAFPISRNWLYAPINMIKKYNFSFAGNGFSSDAVDEYKKHGNYFVMRQFYRVGLTSIFKSLALRAGFTRYEDRHFSGFNYSDNTWSGYADCAVVAHRYEDKKFNHSKLSFGETRRIGETPMQGTYGNVFEDLVFHFGQSNNRKLVNSQLERFGAEYVRWINKIEENGLSEAIISELLSEAKQSSERSTKYWDGNGGALELWNGRRKRVEPLSQKMINELNKLKSNTSN